MPVETKVEIRGLRELGRAFKQVEGDIPNKLKQTFRELAVKVIGRVTAKVPARTGRARASYVPRASTRGAGIAFGGSKAPYVPWLDFGGRVGPRKSVLRPFLKEGRYLYPTLSEMRTEIIDDTDKAIEAAVKAAGFETHDT